VLDDRPRTVARRTRRPAGAPRPPASRAAARDARPERHGTAQHRVSKRDLERKSRIVVLLVALAAAREELGERVPEVPRPAKARSSRGPLAEGAAAPERSAPARIRVLLGRRLRASAEIARLVVAGAALGVLQHLVCGGDLLELLLRGPVARVDVWVVLARV